MAAGTSSTMYLTFAYWSCAGMVEPPLVVSRGEDRQLVPDADVYVGRQVPEDGVVGLVCAGHRGGVGDAPVRAPRVVSEVEACFAGPVAKRDHLVEPTPGKGVEMPRPLAGDIDAELLT